MRLTLRTMLAYMDDILEPADAEDIGGKIADSEFASGLMTRVRDVTRRMRLGAPKLRGRSMGVDPNTVAEYLDNTLSPERIPEFEKICLESDVHLAEVASSHQILALVLGEPADVTQNCRERMYHLVNHQHVVIEEDEPAHEEIPVAPLLIEQAPAADNNGDAKPRPEVPQYLREIDKSQGGGWQLALAASLLVLLGGAIWMAVRPESSAHLAANNPQAPPAALVNLPGQPPAPREVEPAADGLQQPALATQSPETIPGTTPNRGGESSGFATGTPDADLPVATDAAPPAAALDAAEAVIAAPGPSLEGVASETPAAEMDETIETADGSGETTVGEEPAALAADAGRGAATDVGDALGAAPISPVGRVTTNRQVLLALAAGRGEWRRAGSNATVYSDDTLLSPPTYRSTVALRAGITMEMLGSTQVTLLPPDAAGVPGIALNYGRVVLMNIDAAGVPLRIAAPGIETLLTFAVGESAVALEAQPLRQEGVDPELAAAQWNIDLYAVSGQIDWRPYRAGAVESLTAPAHRTIAGLAPAKPVLADEFPVWIVADRLKPIEQKASDALEQALRGERAIRLSLREMVDDRKEEVRAIAARTLAQLDDYEPLLLTLSNPHQQAYWSEQVEQLRSAASRGPESAALVRQALEVRRGKGAPKVYRMLWGYTDTQLREGSAADLVAGLDDDDLMVRVVSFWNLRNISGGKTLNYRPEDPPAKRQPHVQKWRQRQAEGLIRMGQG